MATAKIDPLYKKFAAEYCTNGFNATAAYKKVISKDARQRTAEVQASRLLRHPDVAQYIANFGAEVLEESKITQQLILDRLDEIYDDTDDSRVKIMAIQEQSKILGFYAPSKRELTGKDGGALELKGDLNTTINLPDDSALKRYYQDKK